MPGSGAGSNYFEGYLLQNITGATAVGVTGPTPPASYGTIGFNDSGWCFSEGAKFSKVTFTLEPVGGSTVTGVAISIYGSNSPIIRATWWNALQGPRTAASTVPSIAAGNSLYGGPGAVQNLPLQGMTNAAGYVPGIPPTHGVLIPGPTEQSGTGGIANPITVAIPILSTFVPFSAWRAVVTTAQTGGTFNLAIQGIP